MNAISKLALWLLLSSLLVFGAKAQETPAPRDVKTSVTLICGRAEHARHFVSQNPDLGRALAAVNDAASASSSCLLAPIAFVVGRQIDRIERSEATYAVTEIMIVGVATPFGMLAIEPSVVYTVLKLDGEAA